MKKGLLLLGFGLLLVSCKSEYEERLAQAVLLKEKIERIELMKQNELSPGLDEELEALNQEITFHSKVSGNEEKFLADLFTR